MKTIRIPDYNIVIELEHSAAEYTEGWGGGNLNSDLKGICSYCKEASCDMDCMEFGEHCSDRDPDMCVEKHGERDGFLQYNVAMETLESMILAHAVAGINVESPAYIEGINTAVEACANHI